jgi:hypothetical protein
MAQWRHSPPHIEKELALKRVTLIASALCFTLGAFSVLAEDKMERPDKMEKKADRMGKSDKMERSDRMAKQDKMSKHDKMDRMEKPGAAE